MNKIKRICIFTCIILVTIMFLTNILGNYSVAAGNLSSLNQEKNDLQAQIDSAEKELKQLESKMTEAEKQVSQLSTQITRCQLEIDTLQVQINDNEAKLQQAQADYEKRSKLLANRIIAQYEAGDTQYLDFLLGSESLTDFISTYYMIGEIAEMDVELLDKIENTKKEIEQTKQQLEQDKANLQTQMTTLQNTKSERQTYINQLTGDKKELQDKRDEYDRQLEEIKSEIKRLSQSTPTYIGSGVMAWPIQGYTYVHSPYGYRIHPIYKDLRLHTGIDVAAPTGTNFVAAESGTVIVARSGYGGYGLAVVINHGGGITTLYGHGSQILVSQGQYVTKGTPVLKVGSSGVSTGPHAHFEVRKNGVPVDPMPYIT